jgi:hypothetical protein
MLSTSSLWLFSLILSTLYVVPVTSSCTTSFCVFSNGLLRFGLGDYTAVNDFGLLQTPYYFSTVHNDWFPLSLIPFFSMAIGTGDGGSHWSGADVTMIYGLNPLSSSIDYSGLESATFGDTTIEYGTIIAEITVNINGQDMKIKNEYTLTQDSPILAATTTLINTGDAPILNAIMWIGIQDDWVPGTFNSHSRGNMQDGEFIAISSAGEDSSAIMSFNGREYVLCYSPGTNKAASYAPFGAFENVVYQDPSTIPPVSGFTDGRSYAVATFFGTIAPGQSSATTWYFEARPYYAPTGQPSAQPSGEPSREPSGQPSSQPTGPIQGSWCVDIGLFDSFGNGWGEGVVLRIFDSNDLTAYLDVSNPNTAFVETQLCLDPSLELRTEVTCDNCEMLEPWEMYYTISETKGKNPKSYLGAFNTVMSLHRKDISVIRNKIDYKDDRRSCPDDKCSGGRGDRYADKVIDMTGEGNEL